MPIASSAIANTAAAPCSTQPHAAADTPLPVQTSVFDSAAYAASAALNWSGDSAENIFTYSMAPLSLAERMDGSAALTDRYLAALFRATAARPLSAEERAQWWSSLCDVTLARAESALTQVEQRVQMLFALPAGEPRLHAWTQLTQAERQDINLLLHVTGSTGREVLTTLPATRPAYEFALHLMIKPWMPELLQMRNARRHFTVADAQAMVAQHILPAISTQWAAQTAGTFIDAARDDIVQHAFVRERRSAHAFGAVPAPLQANLADEGSLAPLQDEPADDRLVAPLQDVLANDRSILPLQDEPPDDRSLAPLPHHPANGGLAAPLQDDLAAALLKQWHSGVLGGPGIPSLADGMRGVLAAAAAFDALRRSLIDDMFKAGGGRGAVHFDGFVLRNAAGKDLADLVAVAAQQLGSRFSELDPAQQISLVRQRLCEWGEHPDYLFGSAAQSMASVLMRGSQAADGASTAYPAPMDLLRAFEVEQARWFDVRDQALSPKLHAALHNAVANNVRFSRVQWFTDFWNAQIVQPLSKHILVTQASDADRTALWQWVATHAPGWNASTRTWELASSESVAEGVLNGLEIFNRLKQPAHQPQHEDYVLTMPVAGIPMVWTTYSYLLGNLPEAMKEALCQVASGLDTQSLKQERVLADRWLDTAYRLVKRHHQMSSGQFLAVPRFDWHVAAYAQLLDLNISPEAMVTVGSVRDSEHGPEAKVSVFDTFLKAAERNEPMRLPDGGNIAPAALIATAYADFIGSLDRNDAIRAWAVENLRTRGEVLLPSLIALEIQSIVDEVKAHMSQTDTFVVAEGGGHAPVFPFLDPLSGIGHSLRSRPVDEAAYAALALVRSLAEVGDVAAVFVALARSGPVDTTPMAALTQRVRTHGDVARPPGVANAWVTSRMRDRLTVTYTRPPGVATLHAPEGRSSDGAHAQAWARMMGFLVHTPLPPNLAQLAEIVAANARVEDALHTLDTAMVDGAAGLDWAYAGVSHLAPTLEVGGQPLAERNTVKQVQGILTGAQDATVRHFARLFARHFVVQATAAPAPDDAQTARSDIQAELADAYRQSVMFRRLMNAYDDRRAGPASITITSGPAVDAVSTHHDTQADRWHIAVPDDAARLPLIETAHQRIRQSFSQALIERVVTVLSACDAIPASRLKEERGAAIWLAASVMRARGGAYDARINARSYSVSDTAMDVRTRMRLISAGEIEDQYIEQSVPDAVNDVPLQRCEGEPLGERATVAGAISLLARIDYRPQSAPMEYAPAVPDATPAAQESVTTVKGPLAHNSTHLAHGDFLLQLDRRFTFHIADHRVEMRDPLRAFLWHCYQHSRLFQTLFDRPPGTEEPLNIYLDGTLPANERSEVNHPDVSANAFNAAVEHWHYVGLADAQSLAPYEPFRRVLDGVISRLIKADTSEPLALMTMDRGVLIWCTDWVLAQAGWHINKRLSGVLLYATPTRPVRLVSAMIGELRRFARAEDAFISRWLAARLPVAQT